MTIVSILGAAALLTASAIGFTIWRRRRWRLRYPQDWAFAACTAFGPDLRLPRAVRIRGVFPQISDDLLATWLHEFSRLDLEIERLARAGGPARIGNRVVRASLRQSFPFLVGPGLRQACFLVSYFAWHEGHDESPDEAQES